MCGASEGDSGEQIPFFFYGTLRHGQENYTLLRNYTMSERTACTHNMELYALNSFPMMVPGDGIVYGELTTIFPHLYHYMLEKIDNLEGYRPYVNHCLYRRELIAVELLETGQSINAWAYVGSRQCLMPNSLRITEGDWVKYRNNLIRQTRFGRYIASVEATSTEPP
jgi:gamma-glutamylcyclotransferase (GGCT)/AIG2-like uncharacterized protein YtfP